MDATLRCDPLLVLTTNRKDEAKGGKCIASVNTVENVVVFLLCEKEKNKM